MLKLLRREFLHQSAMAVGAMAVGRSLAQDAGARPQRAIGIEVLNPRNRVPVGLIMDDSTCLVNLNRFAVPQFATALGPDSPHAKLAWRDWPAEIPDSFVRKFGEWCSEQGVKGKYSIVPFPACVGRLDRILPGWTAKELDDSIDLVRQLMLPNWDIHPEMVTHTRVIDLKTGHPYEDSSKRFMENWDWATGRSADELGEYMAFALRILKDVGLPCEGVTTPGGFASRARPQLAQAAFESVRDVFNAEIPHYFRDLFDEGEQSVAPLVQNASGLDGPDPRCVVHTIGCTGDWTGGWDCTPPEGADKFITDDGLSGRMVDVIGRGEPALMVAHWTGFYFNGQEIGFKVFQEVVRRLRAHYDNLHWMKLSEVSRYWAARELTTIEPVESGWSLKAPYSCPDFTLRWTTDGRRPFQIEHDNTVTDLVEVSSWKDLKPNSWCREKSDIIVCFVLPRGRSTLSLK